MSKKQLVLATHNRHKAEELQAMLLHTGIEVLTLDAFPHVGDIVEDRDTLEGNSLKKAEEVFRLTSIASLADDTGLEVDALNGRPGVYSSRYAGSDATYEDNVAKLLMDLNDAPLQHREARFRCVLTFCAPGNVIRRVDGVCRGRIIERPRGSGGFGYDPIFLPDGYDLTFAEMSLDLKNKVSHRARALMKMRDILMEYYGS